MHFDAVLFVRFSARTSLEFRCFFLSPLLLQLQRPVLRLLRWSRALFLRLQLVSIGPFGYACAPLYASEHVKQRTQGTEPTGR